MSTDMFPDAAVDYLIHHSDPVSSPDQDMKMFVLDRYGPLYEVYGYESDVAEYAGAFPEEIYFWAEGKAEDFAPELDIEQVWDFTKVVAVAVNGPTAAKNSGAIPSFEPVREQSGAGVETPPRFDFDSGYTDQEAAAIVAGVRTGAASGKA